MIIAATTKDLELVLNIVSETILEIYPNYYPEEVVSFFLRHHNYENIKNDIENGCVYLLIDNNQVIATGTVVENSMNRVFVLPHNQGKGYGSKLMNYLEDLISEEFNTISLDSSLPAFDIYLKRGYKPIEYHQECVENNRVLCYQVMTKTIGKKNDSTFNLNGRTFATVNNSDNGEVSNETTFHYNQQENCIWADYSGGEIIKGFLVGKFTSANNIYFTYQHINIDGNVRYGECHSELKLLSDGHIRMYESWQWLNGDKSSGTSMIEEIA